MDRGSSNSTNQIRVVPLQQAAADELAEFLTTTIQGILNPPTQQVGTGGFGGANQGDPGTAGHQGGRARVLTARRQRPATHSQRAAVGRAGHRRPADQQSDRHRARTDDEAHAGVDRHCSINRVRRSPTSRCFNSKSPMPPQRSHCSARSYTDATDEGSARHRDQRCDRRQQRPHSAQVLGRSSHEHGRRDRRTRRLDGRRSHSDAAGRQRPAGAGDDRHQTPQHARRRTVAAGHQPVCAGSTRPRADRPEPHQHERNHRSDVHRRAGADDQHAAHQRRAAVLRRHPEAGQRSR